MTNKEILSAYNLKFTDYESSVERLIKHRAEDGARGLDGPFQCLNKYYTVKDSGVTDWTGFPGSGKSYYCLENLISMSFRYGKRYALFVPDIGSPVDVYDKLFKMFTGYDFHSKYRNQIPESEIYKHMMDIIYRFPLLVKKDIKLGVSPYDLWEYTAKYEDEVDGGKLDGCLADSWKNFKHSYSGREDLYLDEALSYRNEVAEEANIHIHTIAHAGKTETNKEGKRRIPTASDIKGGEAWNANGKNIITVDYPDKTRTAVNIFVNKVKPESVGMVGYVVNTIYLDKKKGRYYEFINSQKRFAFEYEKLEDNSEQLSFDIDSIYTDDDDPI